MPSPPPAQIGAPFSEIDTPALIIDLDAFERNLDAMASAVGKLGVRLRPHAKTHKSPVIAAKQIARGAVGMCCQKVAEAEILVAGGVGDVLVSNEVVGARKLERLAALARHARISVCADDPVMIEQLAQAAERAGSQIEVLVEVDVGARRCGVRPGPAATGLARQITGSRFLVVRRLAGLSRLGPASAHAGGAARGHRQCSECDHRNPALPQRSGLYLSHHRWRGNGDVRTRRRQRHLERVAGRAPTSSWTPTTPKTSPTGRAMPARSSMRSLFWRP